MYLALVIVVFSSLVGMAQGFLWKPRMLTSCSRSTQLNYSVKIVNQKKNVEFKVDVPPGKIILDTTESQGVPIPYSCRAGSCSTCVGKLISGSVDQSGQIFLNDKQIEDGYVLTCIATATSDCVIAVDVEDQFYQENPDLVQ